MTLDGVKKTFHIETGETVSFNYVDPALAVSYPSEWFGRNANKKPPIVIPRCNSDMETLKKAVRGGIHAGYLTLKTAIVFLHKYGESIKETLTEDWISFGSVIGRAGETITPWNIVDKTNGPDHVPTESTHPISSDSKSTKGDPNNWTDRAMALYIVCMYRICKIDNNEYKEAVEKRIKEQLAAEGGESMSLNLVTAGRMSWLADRSYLSLIAAIDMFLYKFRLNPNGILRMGTLGSRFIDCAGLLSFGYATSILNISSADLIDWIFIRPMGNELLRITKEGQEIEKDTSYFPYQSDFGLITKSAYSSSANPYLFHWMHIVGSLLGHKRSQNARFNFEGCMPDLGMNAALITWAFAKGGELGPQFNQKERKDYGAEIEVGTLDRTPGHKATEADLMWMNSTGREAKTWFALLKSGGYQFPPMVKSLIAKQQAKIKEARADTVGSYVKEQLLF